MNGNQLQDGELRRRLLMLAAGLALGSCGGGAAAPGPAPAAPSAPVPPAPAPLPGPPPPPGPAPLKSAKRGVAYDFASLADLQALSSGVSWWYNWATRPSSALPAGAASQAGMDYLPMLWNASYDAPSVEAYVKANGNIKYLLVLNEPNLVDQADMAAAACAGAMSAWL